MIFNNMLGLKKDEKELKETQLDYDSSWLIYMKGFYFMTSFNIWLILYESYESDLVTN